MRRWLVRVLQLSSFVNEMGCAITCNHVINLIGNREKVNQQYDNFKKEKATIGKKNYNRRIRELEAKYSYNSNTIIQLNELFVGVSIETDLRYRWISHPTYDLSIIIFENFKSPAYSSYATLLRDSSVLKQGKFLCRLGYPFPEFTNYQYNMLTDNIEWTNNGRKETPRFPIEGMITRNLVDSGKIVGLELSTPGLKGQSGGPLFDERGIICGMQSSTNHLHLGFDMKNFEYKTGGKAIKVTNQPFLHVGQCVHVDVIKEFLASNNITFYES